MNDLMHYGTPRHSGRYPWGSGENPFQRTKDRGLYSEEIRELRKAGMTDKEIAEYFGWKSTELRQRIAINKEEQTAADTARAVALHEKGYSNVQIAEIMGLSGESQVRNLLKYYEDDKKFIITNTANMLQQNVDQKGYIDIGSGVELEIGISREKLNTAVRKLRDEGYVVQKVQVDQLGVTGNKTTVEVLCPPGTTYGDVVTNTQNIHTITEYSTDNGRTYLGIEPPKSISSSRVSVRYAEDGGSEKDGVIEIRRGVEDISLGNAQYAQVRIAVDDSHYLKGMAVYSDDLPKGVDIMFNTNKHKGTPMIGEEKSVLKEMNKLPDGSVDQDNPFGASISKQVKYEGKDGKEHLGCVNIVNEEGEWDTWRRNLSAQVLSKQSPDMAKKQLDISYNRSKSEYDEIMKITNPVLKKMFLEKFADQCDSDAVHLKAAALPRQATKVILPVPSLKDNEVYAPTFRNGESIALIRYPHAGTFEIPIVKVNNKQKDAKELIGQAPDAIGINSKVAQRMSGADFDGDFVLAIPVNERVRIKSTSPLDGLKDFDPQSAYPGYPGMPKMTDRTKGIEMGRISNLITDMTLQGATPEELARAVRHSMVVIDAKKHNLNYKLSYERNGIKALQEKYQNGGGVSTLISRSKSEIQVPERKASYRIDPKTGEKIFTYTGRTYVDKKSNKIVEATVSSTRMAEAKDAYSLSSGTRMENIYANYANEMKALANMSRKESLAIKGTTYSSTANKTYSKEVASLDEKLVIAKLNAPRERQAQILANYIVKRKKESDPELKTNKDKLKKVKTSALNQARDTMGAKKQLIDITDKEWEAIQSGAVTKTKMRDIFENTNLDSLRQRATPRQTTSLSPSKVSLAKALARSGYTQAEIADQLGVSASTVSKAIRS